MEKPITQQPVSRAPNGMVRTRVNMPLTEEELAKLLALAQQEARSIGSMARLIFLRGLATYRQQSAPQTSHSLVFPRKSDYD